MRPACHGRSFPHSLPDGRAAFLSARCSRRRRCGRRCLDRCSSSPNLPQRCERPFDGCFLPFQLIDDAGEAFCHSVVPVVGCVANWQSYLGAGTLADAEPQRSYRIYTLTRQIHSRRVHNELARKSAPYEAERLCCAPALITRTQAGRSGLVRHTREWDDLGMFQTRCPLTDLTALREHAKRC